MEESDYMINELCEALYRINDSFIKTEHMYNKCSNSIYIKNRKIYEILALLLAAQIDISICFKNINKPNIVKYEGQFFLNIAFMKMYEIVSTIHHIVCNPKKHLDFKPSETTKKNILSELERWNRKYRSIIGPKRNHSIAHYEPNLKIFIKDGYNEIDPDFNTQCYRDFFALLDRLREIIRKEIIALESITNI